MGHGNFAESRMTLGQIASRRADGWDAQDLLSVWVCI